MATSQDPLKSQAMKVTLLSKNVFTLEEAELYELANLTGAVIDQKVFKIIFDLLKMNIAPAAIIQMLKHMRSNGKHVATDARKLTKPITKQHTKSDADIVHSARSESGSRRGHSVPRNASGSRSARS